MLATLVVAVVDIAEDAPLVVDLGGVGVASNRLLHEIEDCGGLLLDDVDGAARRARIGASGAALKREYPPTLTEGSDVVQPPGLDGSFLDGADDGNAVGVELDVHHSILDVERFRDAPGVKKPWRKLKASLT